MSLPSRLRIAGWIISLAGAAILVFSGGYVEFPFLFAAGAVIMVLGIIVTSTSPLVSTLQERRRLSARLAELKNAPPGSPSKPE